MTLIKIQKIEFLSPKKRKIFFSNGYSIEISLKSVYTHNLIEQNEYSLEKFNLLKKNLEMTAAENIVLQKLKGRKRSENEIISELKKVNIDTETITEIVEKYRRIGYLNDFDFALSFIKDKVKFGKKPLKIILYELKKSKISSDILNRAIEIFKAENTTTENDSSESIDIQSCRLLAEKKKKKYYGFKTNMEIKNKFIKHLMYRGFSLEIIGSCLANMEE